MDAGPTDTLMNNNNTNARMFSIVLLAAATTTTLIVVAVTGLQQQAKAQTTSTPLNFTQALDSKQFQRCLVGVCIPTVDVVYQGPTMLVLKSEFIDSIWPAVEMAKKEGYKIDAMSTFITRTTDAPGTVNVYVVMSNK
jgi:hypothetical protein